MLFGDWLLAVQRGADAARQFGQSAAPRNALDIAAAIGAAERLYRAQGLPTIFRVPSIADPALDRELAAQGYASEGESAVSFTVGRWVRLELAAVAGDPAGAADARRPRRNG